MTQRHYPFSPQEAPPVPFEALPVLTERVKEPSLPRAAEPTIPSATPPVSPSPRPAPQQPAAGPSQPHVPPLSSPPASPDPAFVEWLTERIAALVREEMAGVAERIIAQIEWEIAQRHRTDPL